MKKQLKTVVGTWAPACCLTLASLLAFFPNALGQTATEIPIGVPGYVDAKCKWVDVNNDGFRDLVITGLDTVTPGWGQSSRIYVNNNGTTFSSLANTFPVFAQPNMAISDWNNDGFMDITFLGEDSVSTYHTEAFENNVGVFSVTSLGFPDLAYGAILFGDLNSDGSNDALATGLSPSFQVAASMLTNSAGSFTQTPSAFNAIRNASIAFFDHDNDGDLDAFTLGADQSSTPVSYAYVNSNGVFSTSSLGIPALDARFITHGDYDADGDIDLAIAGTGTVPSLDIYANSGGVFAPANSGIDILSSGSLRFGDIDNDGDLDVLACGYDQSLVDHTNLYLNNSGTFVNTLLPLPGVRRGEADFVDYDNDGKLDIFIHGSAQGGRIAKLFHNEFSPSSNAAPAAPTGISHTVNPDGSITFQWQAPSDDHTPSAGLSYSLYIGTTPNGTEVCSPPADPATGYRRVVEFGQVVTTTWTLKNVDCANDYYFRVQAVDGGYMGSGFSAPLHVVIAPVASINFNGETLTASVTGAPATSYQWTDANGLPIPGATSISYTITDTSFVGLIVTAGNCSDTIAPSQFLWLANENHHVASSVKIWPNPSATVLHVRVDNPGATESISIYDMQGRLMRTLSTGIASETTLPVEDLTPGLYIVKLSLADGRGIATATFRKD